jgi:hypothetical protein
MRVVMMMRRWQTLWMRGPVRGPVMMMMLMHWLMSWRMRTWGQQQAASARRAAAR